MKNQKPKFKNQFWLRINQLLYGGTLRIFVVLGGLTLAAVFAIHWALNAPL